MSDKIYINKLPLIQQLIANLCDKDNNGVLEKNISCDEISLFEQTNEQYKTGLLDKKISIFSSQFTAVQDAIPNTRSNIIPEIPNNAKILNKKSDKTEEITKISEMIIQESEKRRVKLKPEDIEYWAKKAAVIAKDYNIPPALLISIIGQETNGKFDKNINSKNGAGPMQITKITVNDFFPGAKGNWHDVYKSMNNKLLNDILYKKDKDGNFIKDSKGNYILKYNSPQELRNACAKDDSLGIQVGLLCFEMKYVKAVAQKKFGRATYANVPKIIKGIKNGTITLNEVQNKSAITLALKNYNSVFKSYAYTVVDSLEMHGVKFNDLYFIKQ